MGATNVEKKDVEDPKQEADDAMQKLEKALELCQFGRFHIRMVLSFLTAMFASTVTSTTSSYVLPIAECDLGMTNLQKGILNAAPFIGQLGSSPFTGFLADAFGRKLFLIAGTASMCLCCLVQGLSQNYWMLLIAKIGEGIALSLCFNVASSMLAELTHKGIRDRVYLVCATFTPMAQIMVNLIAWAILPQRQWSYSFLDGRFNIHSWNIYLIVCSIWSLLACLQYSYLPESPKFLLIHGQGEQALENLKKIYCENTGKSSDSFPIKSLHANAPPSNNKKSMGKQLTDALFHMKYLFRRPLVYHLALMCFMNFVCLLAMSTIRLWYPQLSTMIETYKNEHGTTDKFCVMIDSYVHQTNNVTKLNQTLAGNFTDVIATKIQCVPKISGSETYINTIIVSFVTLIAVSITASFVDCLGQKILTFIALLICSACAVALYWTSTSIQIAIVMAITNGFTSAACSLLSSVSVRLFPTTVRTLSAALTVMAGRFGSLVGNVFFPIILEQGCIIPFVVIASLTLAVALLVFLLPNPSKQNKETGDG